MKNKKFYLLKNIIATFTILTLVALVSYGSFLTELEKQYNQIVIQKTQTNLKASQPIDQGKPIDEKPSVFYAINLPNNREADDYFVTKEDELPLHVQPISQGGLSPEASNWSLSFFLKTGRHSEDLEKDRYENMYSEIMNWGGFMRLRAFSRDFSRGSQLMLNLKPNKDYPYWTHTVYLYPDQYSLIAGEWYHVSLVFNHDNPTEPVKVYYNGRYEGPVNIQKERTNEPIPATMSFGEPVKIGQGVDLEFGLAAVELHQRSFTDTEAAQVYFNASKNQPESQQVAAFWNFEGSQNKNQWLQDKIKGFNLQPKFGNAGNITRASVSYFSLPYNPGDAGKNYYPQNTNEKILLDYLLKLGESAENFSVNLEGFKNIHSASFIADLGLLKAAGMTIYMASGWDRLLLQFRDLLAISPTYYLKENFYGKEPSNFFLPVSPASASLLAYFYDLNKPWNNYYRNEKVRNRALVSALSSLLLMARDMNQPNPTSAEFHFLRLSYNAYTCTKICGELPASVRNAWLATLDRSLRQIFLGSSPSSYSFLGTKETDKGLAIGPFINYVIYLDKKFKRPRDIVQQHLQMRDEIFKLYVDPKLSEEAAIISGWEGTNKGIDDSGYCFMDSTINSSYAGLCFDRLTEAVASADKIYQLSRSRQDKAFLERAATPLNRLVELQYYLSLNDKDIFRQQEKISPAHYNSQHHTDKGFANTQSHSETAVLHVMETLNPAYFSYLGRFIKDKFYNTFIVIEKQNGTPVPAQLESRITRVLNDLRNASDSAFLYFDAPSFTQNKVNDHSWALHDSVVRMEATVDKRDFYQELQSNSELSKLPAEKDGNFIKTFGEPGHEAFFAIKGTSYYATFFTDRSPTSHLRDAERTWLGVSGSGLAALGIFDQKNNLYYTPIVGKFVQDIGNEQVSGINWLQWPSHQVSAVDNQGVIYSTSWYETVRKSLNGQRLETFNPFAAVNGYRQFNYDASSCMGGQTGGCVQREYDFADTFLKIKTRLTNPGTDLAEAYDVIPAYLSLNDSAVVFFDRNGGEIPNVENNQLYEDVSLMQIKRDQGSLFIYFKDPVSVKKPAYALHDNYMQTLVQNLAIMMKNQHGDFESEYILYPYLEDVVDIQQLIEELGDL